MVENVGADNGSSTSKIPYQVGPPLSSAIVMKPSFSIHSDAYIPAHQYKDPVTATKQMIENILGSPILALSLIGGATGLTAFACFKTHKAVQAKQLVRSLERRFEAFDLLLDPASGKTPEEIRRFYEQGIHGTLDKYRNAAHINALPTTRGISGDAIQTLHQQERLTQVLLKELEGHPSNSTAVGQLLSHLERNKRLEISSNIILGRLSAIASEARSVRPYSAEWRALEAQKQYVENLCAQVEPSTSRLPAHLDLARRYMQSQVELLQHMQGMQRFRQKGTLKELRSFYARRQMNMSYYLPPDSSFFRSVGLMPSEANHFRSVLASIQNARYRSTRETTGLRTLHRQERAATNDFLTSIENLYIRMSERTAMPLTPSAFSRSGRYRMGWSF